MTSVIRTLLLSNVLPRDIVIQEIFSKHYYKFIKPLTVPQCTSIHDDDFYFNRLIKLYSTTYDRKVESRLYFLSVFDHDFYRSINLGFTVLEKKSQYLSENPNIHEMLDRYIDREDLLEYLRDIWCMLSNEKRHDVYKRILENHEAMASIRTLMLRTVS